MNASTNSPYHQGPPLLNEHDVNPVGADGPELELSPEGMNNWLLFFSCLRAVIRRLLSEGYTIQNGKLIPPKVKSSI